MSETHEQALASIPTGVKEAPGDRDWAAQICQETSRKQSKALASAASSGHLWRVHYLLNLPHKEGGVFGGGSSGADPNHSSGQALRSACSKGHFEVVKALIEYDADPNQTYEYHSPLKEAAQRGHLEITRYLVEHGADISWRNYIAVNNASGAVKSYFSDLLGQTATAADPQQGDAKQTSTSNNGQLWEKINDFTVSSYSWNSNSTFSLRRVFNFQSREVGTVYYEVDRDGDARMMSAAQTQRFSDMDDDAEVAAAHEQLVRLGGNPGEYKPSRVVNKIKPGG